MFGIRVHPDGFGDVIPIFDGAFTEVLIGDRGPILTGLLIPRSRHKHEIPHGGQEGTFEA